MSVSWQKSNLSDERLILTLVIDPTAGCLREGRLVMQSLPHITDASKQGDPGLKSHWNSTSCYNLLP